MSRSNTSTSDFFTHFVTGRLNNEHTKRRKPHKQEKLNNNYDKLFFNFLVISMPEVLSERYDVVKERKLKYEFSHKMENMKYKKLDTVVNNLCYDETINLHTLSALAHLFNKSLVFSSNNVFCSLNQTMANETHRYMVTGDKEIHLMSNEKIMLLQEKSFVIQDITKPYYSNTYYKVDDLNCIIQSLNIELEDKKNLKKELYDKMTQYLNKCLF